MIGRWAAPVALAVLAGCSWSKNPGEVRVMFAVRAREVASRAAAADSLAAAGTPTADPIALWILPPRYDEISGLALTADGRLLAQGDETSEIWEIDYRRGVVTKSFVMGDQPFSADFEGITVAEGLVYMMDSKGRLYESAEGKNGAHVPYNQYDTRLRDECEFEGVAFDPARRSLLLACKHVHRDAPDDALVIYRWPLPGTVPRATVTAERTVIPMASLRALGVAWPKFEASEITRDPRSGNFLVMSSLQQGLVLLSPALAPIGAGRIPGHHRQPEGAAITADGRLIVSDEAAGGKPALTVYPSTPR